MLRTVLTQPKQRLMDDSYFQANQDLLPVTVIYMDILELTLQQMRWVS